MAPGEKSYLKGKARRWFWLSMVMLAFMALWSVLSPALYMRILIQVRIGTKEAFLIGGIQTFLYAASWLLMTAVYGLTNKVRVFKIMFLVLGGCYLLGAYGHFQSNVLVMYIQGSQGGVNPVIHTATRVLSLLLQAVWIIFTVVVICQPKAGRGLKASAIVLLLSRGIGLAYSLKYDAISYWLNMRYDTEIETALTWFMGVVMTLVAFIPVMFFLGAMSFGRMKAEEEHAPSDIM